MRLNAQKTLQPDDALLGGKQGRTAAALLPLCYNAL